MVSSLIRSCVRQPFLVLAVTAVVGAPDQPPSRTVAVTVDDLPGVSRTGSLEVFQQMNAAMLDVMRSQS